MSFDDFIQQFLNQSAEGDAVDNAREWAIYHDSKVTKVNNRGGIYIEKVENMHAPLPMKLQGRAEEMTTGEEEKVVEDYVSPIEVLKLCIIKLMADGTITHPGDFCCIFKMDQEMSIVGFESFNDYKTRIDTLFPTLDKKLRFTADHNKRFGWGKKALPDWPWENMPEGKAPHYKALSKCLVRFMAAHGFRHPNYDKIIQGNF